MNEEKIETPASKQTTATETTPVAPGRPVNPTSKRQQRLAELNAKRNDPFFSLGRPVNPESKRQQQIKAQQEKKTSGYVAPKGRPKMTEEQKAEAKKQRDARYATLAALKAEKITEVNTMEFIPEDAPVMVTETNSEINFIVDTPAPEETITNETDVVTETPLTSEETKVTKKSRRSN